MQLPIQAHRPRFFLVITASEDDPDAFPQLGLRWLGLNSSASASSASASSASTVSQLGLLQLGLLQLGLLQFGLVACSTEARVHLSLGFLPARTHPLFHVSSQTCPLFHGSSWLPSGSTPMAPAPAFLPASSCLLPDTPGLIPCSTETPDSELLGSTHVTMQPPPSSIPYSQLLSSPLGSPRLHGRKPQAPTSSQASPAEAFSSTPGSTEVPKLRLPLSLSLLYATPQRPSRAWGLPRTSDSVSILSQLHGRSRQQAPGLRLRRLPWPPRPRPTTPSASLAEVDVPARGSTRAPPSSSKLLSA